MKKVLFAILLALALQGCITVNCPAPVVIRVVEEKDQFGERLFWLDDYQEFEDTIYWMDEIPPEYLDTLEWRWDRIQLVPSDTAWFEYNID